MQYGEIMQIINQVIINHQISVTQMYRKSLRWMGARSIRFLCLVKAAKRKEMREKYC